VQQIGLVAGPLLALLVFATLPDAYTTADGEPASLGTAGRATAAVAVWMATWWLSEAISLYATALLPLALFPLLGAASIRATAAPYAHELIFLFMGGFLLALAMQRWGLHRRIALTALLLFGDRPSHMVGGFMVVTAMLSMWVSNTATAIMMLPVAVSVVDLVARQVPATAAPRRHWLHPMHRCTPSVWRSSSGSPARLRSAASERPRISSSYPSRALTWVRTSASCAGWDWRCRWWPSCCRRPGSC
jgi:di/tricarboxylate transporter